MARSRNIKPGFFENETLAELDFGTRLLFIGLWTLADRDGYLEDRPKRIKMKLFPMDDFDVESGLRDLYSHGFIQRYKAQGMPCIFIPSFSKHQNPHHKEKSSNIPKPESSTGQALGSESIKTDEKPEACTRQEQDKPSSSPADSLLLIPDSLIPESGIPSTPLSGKPSGTASPLPAKSAAQDDTPVKVIEYLNDKAKRKFPAKGKNLTLVKARIAEGATFEQLTGVVDLKCHAWLNDPKMHEYLRPATLFGQEKFAQYVGQLGMPRPKTKAEELDEAFGLAPVAGQAETMGDVFEGAWKEVFGDRL